MEAAAPFACPGLECSSVFTEMGLLRRHLKYEHLNKWPRRHKYIHANLVNVEIPKETRHFAQLKILDENDRNHNERCGNSFWKWRKSEKTKQVSSRGPTQDEGRKNTEVEEERAEIWTTT